MRDWPPATPRTPPGRERPAPGGRTASSPDHPGSRRFRGREPRLSPLRARGATVGDRMPGPSAVWLVRHAESMGNVADARAHEQGAGRLTLDVRDPDVALSETGCAQAQALGRWMAGLPADER